MNSVIDMSQVNERKDIAPVSESTALLQVLERASRDPAVDTAKLRELMAIRKEIRAEIAEAAFNAAMADCQAEMLPVSANATNPQTKSKYATYAKLDSALRPIYTKHGFSISFGDGVTDKPEHVRIVATIRHREGHKETGFYKDMPADGKGAKGGDVMTKTHATGAADSYGRRYLLKDIFNVAVGEGDKDGNSPGTAQKLVSEEQLANIRSLMTEVNANQQQFMKLWKINALSEILACNYDTVIQLLQAKRR